jgi:hypothetical protein
MTKLALRCVTQGTFLMALIAALSFTPGFAFGGFGGGGGVPAGLLRLDPPPSSYPRRSGIKATHKIKKNTKQSNDPAFSLGYLKEGAQARAAGETLAEIAKS